MTRSSALGVIALPLAALAALLAHPAAADPMRPLAGIGTAGSNSGGGAASAPATATPALAASAASPSAPGAAPAAMPPLNPLQPADRLVAIRHDAGRGFQALIGERWLGAGDRLGSVTISSIDGNGLQTADSRGKRTRHRLLPALQGAAPQPAAPTGTPQ